MYQRGGNGPLRGIKAGFKQWNQARKRKKSFNKQKKGFWKGCGKKGKTTRWRSTAENCTDPAEKTVAKYGGTYKKLGGYKTPAWTRKAGQSPTGGLNATGRASAKAGGSNLKSQLSSGTDPRRISFAARFAGMKGPMKKPDGSPTRKKLALKKWGFGSVGSARRFARAHKKKK